MMLLNSLYTLVPDTDTELLVTQEDMLRFSVLLNPNHFIYAAHFPGNPITPGVCLVQMVVELLSLGLKQELELLSMNDVKFLKPVSPLAIPCVAFEIRYSNHEMGWRANCNILAGEDICARMKLICSQK